MGAGPKIAVWIAVRTGLVLTLEIGELVLRYNPGSLRSLSATTFSLPYILISCLVASSPFWFGWDPFWQACQGHSQLWPVSLGRNISVNIKKVRIDHLWTDLQRNFSLIVSSRQGLQWGYTKFKLDCGMTCPKWPDQVCRVVVLVLTSCGMLSSRTSFSHPCTVDSACDCAFPPLRFCFGL